jgi:hypothetical protein
MTPEQMMEYVRERRSERIKYWIADWVETWLSPALGYLVATDLVYFFYREETAAFMLKILVVVVLFALLYKVLNLFTSWLARRIRPK